MPVGDTAALGELRLLQLEALLKRLHDLDEHRVESHPPLRLRERRHNQRDRFHDLPEQIRHCLSHLVSTCLLGRLNDSLVARLLDILLI